MARDYESKNDPNGRGRKKTVDDAPAAKSILFEQLIAGHDLNKIMAAAAPSAGKTGGKPDPAKHLRERLTRAIHAEMARYNGPLLGLPAASHVVAALLNAVKERDGYQAARTVLIEAIALSIHLDEGARPPSGERGRDCVAAVEAWVAELEAEADLMR